MTHVGSLPKAKKSSENKLVALTATLCPLTPPGMSCPGWDLNPHRTEFETAASAVGLPGRPKYVSPEHRKGLTLVG